MDAEQPAVVKLTPVYQPLGIQPQKRRAEEEREVGEDESKKVKLDKESEVKQEPQAEEELKDQPGEERRMDSSQKWRQRAEADCRMADMQDVHGNL